jgi:hypothetical protein
VRFTTLLLSLLVQGKHYTLDRPEGSRLSQHWGILKWGGPFERDSSPRNSRPDRRRYRELVHPPFYILLDDMAGHGHPLIQHPGVHAG